jgi:hypothetical protein
LGGRTNISLKVTGKNSTVLSRMEKSKPILLEEQDILRRPNNVPEQKIELCNSSKISTIQYTPDTVKIDMVLKGKIHNLHSVFFTMVLNSILILIEV